jgi:hypothetical protein
MAGMTTGGLKETTSTIFSPCQGLCSPTTEKRKRGQEIEVFLNGTFFYFDPDSSISGKIWSLLGIKSSNFIWENRLKYGYVFSVEQVFLAKESHGQSRPTEINQSRG